MTTTRQPFRAGDVVMELLVDDDDGDVLDAQECAKIVKSLDIDINLLSAEVRKLIEDYDAAECAGVMAL